MATALIVTRSADIQQGLGALLESLSVVNSVIVIREPADALRWIETHRPQIVLLDLGHPGKAPGKFLDTVQVHSPGTKRVLLVDDLEDVNWVPRNAEAILLKGTAPSVVVATILNLLQTEGDQK